MSTEDERMADGLSPHVSEKYPDKANAPIESGSGGTDRLNDGAAHAKRLAAAKRYLDQAWLCFATGVEDVNTHGRFGYIIDAFGDGVDAACAYFGTERPDHYSAVQAVNALLTEGRLEKNTRTTRLINAMNHEPLAEHLISIVQADARDLTTLLDDLRTFLEQVARLLDPSMATTSFANAIERWEEISEHPW